MDRIHEADAKPWISSRKCRINDLIRYLNARLETSGLMLNVSPTLEHLPDAEVREQFDELAHKLEAFAKLRRTEIAPHFMFNSADERLLVDTSGCPLQMVQLQLEHAKRMISDRAYKVEYLTSLRTTRRELLMRQLAMSNRDREGGAHLEAVGKSETAGRQQKLAAQLEVAERKVNEVVATIVVQLWTQPARHEKIRLEREMLFHPEQLLTELRDQFKCQRDYGIPMDLSENPEQQAERVFRCELFKSAYFLIENTFYNDMRDPNNTDLSAPIVGWASDEVTVVGEDGRNCKVGRGVGPFKRERMEQVTFGDIDFRLGYPYLYSHQGDCEHLFTISDIRYVPNDDEFKRTNFPFVTATSIGRKEDSLKCYMCQGRPPHWYTRNNSRLPVDPYFFCENCFYSFNYDSEKRKIGKFQAYLYTGSHGIPDRVTMNPIKSVATALK